MVAGLAMDLLDGEQLHLAELPAGGDKRTVRDVRRLAERLFLEQAAAMAFNRQVEFQGIHSHPHGHSPFSFSDFFVAALGARA